MSPTTTSSQTHYRPHIHYAPAANWMNDPNGLVYCGGLYHLYYQYNPYSDTHGHMHWGKATSPDLVHWQEHDIALPQHEHEIFSGSAVVDWHNTSGFGQGGKVPLVACYTGHMPGNQSQFLAYSLDEGEHWTYHPQSVLDAGKQDFRDPKVFWHQETQKWVMALVHPNERQIELFASPNLHDWQPLSLFGPAGAVDGIWEVPELFPVEGGSETHWIMKVDLNPGGPNGGSGVQYWLGDFDGVAFTPSTPARWVDYGKDFYAALSWNEVAERRVWLAWMNNWQYAQQVPTPGQRGMMSLPRELRVVQTHAGPLLAQRPVPELQQLRQGSRPLGEHTPLAAGQAHELQLSWAFDTGSDAGARLELEFHSAAGPECSVAVDPVTLSVIRPEKAVSAHLPGYAGVHQAPLVAGAEQQTLTIFLDACSIEVFAEDGCSVISDLLYPEQHIQEVRLKGSGMDMSQLQAEVWELRSLR